MKGEYDAALKLHKAHLSFAQELSDYAALGRAYGNMGNAYHALGIFDQAVRYHRQELQISLEVNSRSLHGRHVDAAVENRSVKSVCVSGERSSFPGLHTW